MSIKDSRGRNKFLQWRSIWKMRTVLFKLLAEPLVQYGVSLTLTRWLVAALQERKVAMRFGNWMTTSQQLTMGLLQGFPLSLSSTMSTHRDWRISPAMVKSGCSRLQATGLSTKQPVASTKQSLLSKSSWKRCHIGAKRQSLKSIQARRKPCGVPAATKQ